MKKKISDDQLPLFPPLKRIAEQFELKPISEDGLTAFREERKTCIEINQSRPRPNFTVGDTVATEFCASTSGLAFTVKAIYVCPRASQTGWLVDAFCEDYAARNNGNAFLRGLDSAWFQKLLL